jgi:hypothetical protein
MGISIPGLTSNVNVSRVDSGEGHVRERTFDIGETVVNVMNIGSMILIEGIRNPLPAVIGALVAVWGLIELRTSSVTGLVEIAIGGGFAWWWWFVRKVDVFLSIGTSDGRRTNIVSKDKKFLEQVRNVLRQKIDTPDVTVIGTVNLGNHSINVSTGGGGVSFGADSIATGRNGSVSMGAATEPGSV